MSDGEVQPTRRTSKRRVHQLPAFSCLRGEHNQRNKSSLQFHLERVLESGGIGRILQLVRTAIDREVDEVNASAWTPLVGAIFLLGKDTTAKGNTAESEERLLQLVGACHRRGISLNSSAWFGGRLHRALTVAAYYGYYSVVRLLVELGALPDLRDGGQSFASSMADGPNGNGAHRHLSQGNCGSGSSTTSRRSSSSAMTADRSRSSDPQRPMTTYRRSIRAVHR